MPRPFHPPPTHSHSICAIASRVCHIKCHSNPITLRSKWVAKTSNTMQAYRCHSQSGVTPLLALGWMKSQTWVLCGYFQKIGYKLPNLKDDIFYIYIYIIFIYYIFPHTGQIKGLRFYFEQRIGEKNAWLIHTELPSIMNKVYKESDKNFAINCVKTQPLTFPTIPFS